jgi:hypothetical protein
VIDLSRGALRILEHAQFEAMGLHLDPFQTQGAPCFGPPANDRDWEFLFGNDPEEEYQP